MTHLNGEDPSYTRPPSSPLSCARRLRAAAGSCTGWCTARPEACHPVASNPAHVRGFGYQGGHVSGHAEFKKVPSASISPALALTAASAVLGAYWQQQIDDKLRGIQTALDGFRSRLDAELDAKFDLAERTLTEDEAAPIGVATNRHLPSRTASRRTSSSAGNSVGSWRSSSRSTVSGCDIGTTTPRC